MLSADKDKHQWFTPVWFAQKLIEHFFPDLNQNDIVIEPTCGTGNFLKALPHGIPAYGIELDPSLADIARKSCGHPVYAGDFTTIDLPAMPTAMIGNPPFDLDVIDAILKRSHDILPDQGKFGMILPAYAFQTASRLVEYKSKWSVLQEMIPRNIFNGIEKPLCFALFTKDRAGTLIGFRFYEEVHDVNSMPKKLASLLATQTNGWKIIVARALHELGGKATLTDLYKAIEPKRPSQNNWWKEKVRQTLSRHDIFSKDGSATFKIDYRKLA